MKKFIRKHSPPDVEGIQQAPVSILKKSRLTDASVRKSVVITEKREQELAEEEQELMPLVISEPDSEDSALCLEPEETENDAQGTLGSVGDRERRKWVEKAVPMSNNPYTKENIVRRKRSSNSGDFVSMRPSFETEMDVAGGDITSLYVSMYKRDYYMHPDQLPDLARTSDKTNRREENKSSSSETMAEFSIFSPHEVHHHERDSCEENLDDSFDPDTDNDDDTGTVPDSGVSEAGSQLSEDVPSEVSTISVTDEIKRFQKEINIVAVENSKFFKWKKERTPSKIGMSSDSLSAPKIQFNKTDHIQESNDYEDEDSVSNSDKAITVLGIPEERPNFLFVKKENNLVNCANGNERSRQIQPSSHVPPSYLPNGEATDDPAADTGDESEKDAEEEEEDEVPALPSVRMLTNKFQTIKVDKPTPPARNAHSKAVPAVARTWKKKFNNNNSMQVHSITARSVSRQFRESLKAGKSELVDTIFKLPEAKNISRLQEDTLHPGNNYKDRVDNVVYSSQSPHELYPDGDYIVTRRTAEAIRDASSGDEETRDW